MEMLFDVMTGIGFIVSGALTFVALYHMSKVARHAFIRFGEVEKLQNKVKCQGYELIAIRDEMHRLKGLILALKKKGKK